MNLQALHMLTIKMLLIKSNLDAYYDGSINQTRATSYFPNPDFKEHSIKFALDLKNAFKDNIHNCLKSRSVIHQSVKAKL